MFEHCVVKNKGRNVPPLSGMLGGRADHAIDSSRLVFWLRCEWRGHWVGPRCVSLCRRRTDRAAVYAAFQPAELVIGETAPVGSRSRWLWSGTQGSVCDA